MLHCCWNSLKNNCHLYPATKQPLQGTNQRRFPSSQLDEQLRNPGEGLAVDSKKTSLRFLLGLVCIQWYGKATPSKKKQRNKARTPDMTARSYFGPWFGSSESYALHAKPLTAEAHVNYASGTWFCRWHNSDVEWLDLWKFMQETKYLDVKGPSVKVDKCAVLLRDWQAY